MNETIKICLYAILRGSNFNNSILQLYIRPSPNNTYNFFNSKGIKTYITRLRLGFIHLCGNKCKYGFLVFLNRICSCRFNIETTCHYLFQCANFTNERSILLDTGSTINKDSLTSSDIAVVKLFVHGDRSLNFRLTLLY